MFYLDTAKDGNKNLKQEKNKDDFTQNASIFWGSFIQFAIKNLAGVIFCCFVVRF